MLVCILRFSPFPSSLLATVRDRNTFSTRAKRQFNDLAGTPRLLGFHVPLCQTARSKSPRSPLAIGLAAVRRPNIVPPNLQPNNLSHLQLLVSPLRSPIPCVTKHSIPPQIRIRFSSEENAGCTLSLDRTKCGEVSVVP